MAAPGILVDRREAEKADLLPCVKCGHWLTNQHDSVAPIADIEQLSPLLEDALVSSAGKIRTRVREHPRISMKLEHAC